MRNCTAAALALLVSLLAHSAGAEAPVPDGTWLVSQRVALNIFSCQNALCARIAWLRNPALRTPAMCSRTIIWGLTSDGPAQWGNGWFFDSPSKPTQILTCPGTCAKFAAGTVKTGTGCVPLTGVTR